MRRICRGGHCASDTAFRGFKRTAEGRRYMVLPVLMIILLSSCSSIWEREVYERAPHITQEEAAFQSTELTANSRDSLKSVIINVISNGLTEAVIRITDYRGELNRSTVSALLDDIQRNEPIGAYAVGYMVLDYTQVLSQYTIALTISYTRDNLSNLQPVSGKSALTDAVNATLSDYKSSLTVDMLYFDAKDHDMEGMVRSYYYNNPAWAMEYPGIDVTLYPASGVNLHRIAELTLTFNEPPGILRQKAVKTDINASLLEMQLPSLSADSEEFETAQTVLRLHDLLCDTIQYDNDTAMLAVNTGERQGGDTYTAYGALVNNSAVSEGYAMAFKLICDKLGIPCRVVTGILNGYDYAWNLVRIGELWYHIGTAFDDRGPVPVYDYFLLSDETAAQAALNWDKSQYPSAQPGPWNYESIAAQPEGIVPDAG